MKSPIEWVEGKSRLVNKLLPLIPKHKCYVEVFSGAGWLLFAKEPSQVEILNDFKAHVFYYLVKAGFGADMINPRFGTDKGRNGLRIEQIDKTISEAYKRLQKVTIENKSFEDMFKIYDNENTFFYLDPPYRGTYGHRIGKFTDTQYQLLADCCKKAKGKWLMTINDDEYIKELFKNFNIISHDVYYSICKTQNGRQNFKELIITNYDLHNSLKPTKINPCRALSCIVSG